MIETIWDLALQLWGLILTLRQTNIRVWDVIDILLMAIIIYRILSFMQKTSASSVIKGLLLLLCVAWISSVLEMNILSFLLRQVMQMGVLVVIVLFQPEIRKIFERMGTTKLNNIFRIRGKQESIESVLRHIFAACYEMSKNDVGAIIVIERKVGLNDFAVTGVDVDAIVSTEIILNIFFQNSPLHDGALIIRENRVLAAACMLPLSNNYSLGKDLGMRHRAGIGLSERSDAVVIIVSEQTSSISVAIDGMLKRNLDNETFEKLILSEVITSYNDRSRRKNRKPKVKSDVKT